MAATNKTSRKPISSRAQKKKQTNTLNFQTLEARHLLASVTVGNATDLSNAPDVTSISALLANDGGDGISLREAITASNSTVGEDTITFDGSVFTGGANSLIRLTQGELEITETLTIDASMATDVTITGDANGDDVTVPGTFITNVAASFGGSTGAADDLLDDNSRVLNFTGGTGDLTFTGLVITGGSTLGFGFGERGGGVRVSSTGILTVNQSSISGNSTRGNTAWGGGIYTRSNDAYLTNSTLGGNITVGDRGLGAGIFAFSGNVSLLNSAVVENSALGSRSEGGGINALIGNVSLTNSVVSGNSISGPSRSRGGGIFSNSGDVSLVDSTVSGNSAGGDDAIAYGGGISSTSGDISLVNSTVSGNSAIGNAVNSTAGRAFGGGISTLRGEISLINSTVSGNSATGTSPVYGGAVHSFGLSVRIVNSTVTGNSTSGVGGGLHFDAYSSMTESLTIINSIIADNTDDGTAPDLSGIETDTLVVSYSLIGDTTGSGIAESTGNKNILNQPALLGPMADNGGPTMTHALLSGSPAIDAGSNTLALDADGVLLTTDQRGDGFDRIKFGQVDIGAFESNFDVPPIAPAVLSATVDEGGKLARPDLWNSLTVVFDIDVTVAAGDLSLVNDSAGGVAVDLTEVGFSYDSVVNTATWDFGTLDNPLEAAFYTYQLDAGSIVSEGLALDGNLDGTGGDDAVGQHYVAIPGDLNLDGDVDVSQIVVGPGGVENVGDASIMLAHLPTVSVATYYDGDLNGDGDVDVTQIVFGPAGVQNVGDASILLANLGRSVVPPEASILSSTAGTAASDLAGKSGDLPQPAAVRQTFTEPLGQWESAWHQTVRERLAVADAPATLAGAHQNAHQATDEYFAESDASIDPADWDDGLLHVEV